MGVFSREHIGESGHVQSPFDEIIEEHKLPMRDYRRSRQLSPRLVFGLGLGFLVIALFVFFLQMTSQPPDKKMAFFQVKALGDKGYPIAGAFVFLNGKKVGVTDAFGEWHRYLNMDSAKRHEIKIEKANGLKSLNGGKLFQVDGEKDEPVSVVLRIKLTAGDRLRRVKAFHKTNSGRSAKISGSFDSIALVLKKPKNRRTVDGDQYYKRLRSKTMPTLRKILIKNQVRIDEDSSNTMNISYISHSGRSGFMKVDGSYLRDAELKEFSFLRKFGNTSNDTARDILSVFRAQVAKTVAIYKEGQRWFVLDPADTPRFWRVNGNDILYNGLSLLPLFPDTVSSRFEVLVDDGQKPCSNIGKECDIFLSTLNERPPRSGWERMRVKLAGRHKLLSLYVSGFEAKPLGQGVYEFWGQNDRYANITALRGTKIVGRQRLLLRSGQPSLMILPGATVARR